MSENFTIIELHTDTFSDSFSPELCAYLAGQSNPYMDDLPEVEDFEKNTPKKIKERLAGMLVEALDPEHRSPEYYTSLNTPGWYNHGMGGIFEDIPENDKKALAHYKKVSKEWYENHYSGKELEEKLKELKDMKKVNKYLTTQGARLEFQTMLTPEELKFIDKRIHQFFKSRKIKLLSLDYEYQEVKKKSKKIKIK